VKKSLVHLADGRELFFFDHDVTAATTDRADVTALATWSPPRRRPRSGTTWSSTNG
jgi:hypothetical protein